MKNMYFENNGNLDDAATNPNLIDYMRTLVLRKLDEEKVRTADNYLSSINKFCLFQRDKADDLTLLDLTPELLQDYLQWLIHTEKLSEGTIHFYVRTLKAMYNKGVKEFHLQPSFSYPFEKTTIKVPPTRKRALPDVVFDRLMSLDLTDKPNQLSALHLAMFIFYARGMSFIDVFKLTNENIVDNYIIYVRSKTKVSLQVKITPEMKHLLKIYRKKNNPWIFPFLHEKIRGKGQVSPLSSLRRINRYLKDVGEILGLQYPLTTYVMRHSWASLMYEAGSDLGVISQSLGHTSMHTTEIYLSNLSVGKMDKAADDMLNTFIRKKKFYRKELLKELLDEQESTEEVQTKGDKAMEQRPLQETKKENSLSKVWTAIHTIASSLQKHRRK